MKHDTKLACGTSIKEVKHLLDGLTFTRLYRAMSEDSDEDIRERHPVYPNAPVNTFSVQCTLIPIAVEYRLPDTGRHGAPVSHPFAWIDSTQNLVLERDRPRHTPARCIPAYLNSVQQKLLVLQVEDLYFGTNTAKGALEEQRLSLLTHAAHET